MSKRLLVSQLGDIIEALKKNGFSNARWYILGLRLGIVKNTLDLIEEQHGDFDRCLIEGVRCWLRRIDDVMNEGEPSWITLTNSLRSINELVVADNIDREKQPAYFIFHRHRPELTHNIMDPIGVAIFLQNENVLSDDDITSIERKPVLHEKKRALLAIVQDFVCTDHRNLWIFGSILERISGNIHITNDYNEIFNSNVEYITIEDTQVATDHGTAIDGRRILVPKSASSEFNEMRVRFGRMLCRLRVALESRQHQLRSMKLILQCNYLGLHSRLSVTETVDEVVSLAQGKCSLINISLFDEMIEQIELKEAAEFVKPYKEEIDKFCQKTSIRSCLNETFQLSVPCMPLQCETVTFVLNWNPDDHVLDEVRSLLTAVFESLAYKIKVIFIKGENPVIVICTFPVHIAMLFVSKAFENLELFRKGLLKFTIGYVTIWDEQNKDEELIQLKDQVREMTEELSLRKDEEISTIEQSILEKEEEIKRLNEELAEKEEYEKSLMADSSMSKLKEKLIEYEKENKEMSLEIEKLKKFLESKEEIESDLVVNKEELEALRDKVTQLDLEVLEYKNKNSKLMQENEDL